MCFKIKRGFGTVAAVRAIAVFDFSLFAVSSFLHGVRFGGDRLFSMHDRLGPTSMTVSNKHFGTRTKEKPHGMNISFRELTACCRT